VALQEALSKGLPPLDNTAFASAGGDNSRTASRCPFAGQQQAVAVVALGIRQDVGAQQVPDDLRMAFEAARSKAVAMNQPFTSAPATTSSCTTSAWPFAAASQCQRLWVLPTD
jgi:hypothetical protein